MPDLDGGNSSHFFFCQNKLRIVAVISETND